MPTRGLFVLAIEKPLSSMCQVLKVRRECLYTSKGTMDEDLGYFKADQTYNGQRGGGSGKKGNLVAATVASLRQLCISTSLCIALRTPSGPDKWQWPLGRENAYTCPLYTQKHICVRQPQRLIHRGLASPPPPERQLFWYSTKKRGCSRVENKPSPKLLTWFIPKRTQCGEENFRKWVDYVQEKISCKQLTGS